VRRFASIASLTVGVLCATTSLVHAQGYAGFRAGGTAAQFTGTDADQFDGTRNGFIGGGFIGFDKGKRMGFRADMLYQMKGAISGESSIKLDYLEIGTMLVGRFSLTDRFQLRAFLGPLFGVFVNAEGDSGPVDIDFGDIVEHFELSGVIGAELDVRTGPYFALFEVRYTQGSRVFEDKGLDGEPLDFTVSNSSLSAMAGLMVPF
jgi:hypothetical protein